MYGSSSFGVDEDYLDIQNYEMTLKILHIFGSSIHRLSVGYVGMSSSEVKEINRLIREKSADQLIEFRATFRGNELNSLLTAPFPKVETATFAVGHLKSMVDLNQIFPRLSHLTLHSTITKSGELIDRHFPHLTHFTIYFFDQPGLTEHDFESMLRKNPQITTIAADHCSLSFLEILRENSLNLESLQLDNLQLNLFSAGNAVVRFERVKKLTLQVFYGILLTPAVIPFEFGDQLEEVTLVWSHFRLGDRWTAFIERNSNIQIMTVHYSSCVCRDYAYLTDLNLPELREITLRGIDLNAEDEIDNFFSKVNNWNKLETMNFVDVSKSHEDVLRKQSGAWKVTEFENAEDADVLVDVRFDKILM